MMAVCAIGCLVIGVLIGFLLGRVAGGAMIVQNSKDGENIQIGQINKQGK